MTLRRLGMLFMKETTLSLRLTVLLIVFGVVACQKQPVTDSVAVPASTPVAPTRSHVTLAKPIGITTAGNVFSPLIPAGQALPIVHSETFGNATNGKGEVLVELSQKGAAGSETVASLRIKIPPAANRTLDIVVTLTVSESKQMTVKTTVSQTASTQEFGPYTVD